MIKIAPSILAADVLHLERDVRRAVEGGCDWLHIDIMDAHFVPNLSYSPAVVSRLKETFDVPLDVHLMMNEPEKWIDVFLRSGADILTIHAESADAESDSESPLSERASESLAGLLERIRGGGARAGIAIRPGTGLAKIRSLLPHADLVLTMTVEPGFGGQKMQESVIDKIRALRECGYAGEIEADGGLTEENLPVLVGAGLSVAVMGTAVFGQKDPAAVIRRLRGEGEGRP